MTFQHRHVNKLYASVITLIKNKKEIPSNTYGIQFVIYITAAKTFQMSISICASCHLCVKNNADTNDNNKMNIHEYIENLPECIYK